MRAGSGARERDAPRNSSAVMLARTRAEGPMRTEFIDVLNLLLTIAGIVRGPSRVTIPLGPDLALVMAATPRKLGAALAMHTATGPLMLGPVTTPIT